MRSKRSRAASALRDFDGDGDLDLFIGGRVSKEYPLPARSYILHNKKGIFTDVTEKVCPALQKPGMVTAAVWADFDNDKQTDLIITGEWMAVRFFKNNHGLLKEVTDSTGLDQYAWNVAKPDCGRYRQ